MPCDLATCTVRTTPERSVCDMTAIGFREVNCTKPMDAIQFCVVHRKHDESRSVIPWPFGFATCTVRTTPGHSVVWRTSGFARCTIRTTFERGIELTQSGFATCTVRTTSVVVSCARHSVFATCTVHTTPEVESYGHHRDLKSTEDALT